MIALAHLVEVMVSWSSPLASHISGRWSVLSRSIERKTLKAMVLQVLALNSMLEPILSQSLCWLSVVEIQMAASSESISIRVPPFRVMAIVRILPVGSPISGKILFSLSFS